MNNCGHHFHENGDLTVYYRRGRLILAKRVGFRDGVKCLVDSYCEPACPECGCPERHYHACRCPRGPGQPRKEK